MSKLATLRTKISHWGLAAIYVDDPTNIAYLTGLNVSRAIVLLGERNAWILLDNRYNLAVSALEEGWNVVFADAQIDRDRLLQQELQKYVGVIGFDGGQVSFRQAEMVKQLCPERVLFRDEKDCFPMLRRPKDGKEIEKIAAACLLCTEGFEYLLKKIQRGVSEKELAKELTIFWFNHGAARLSFEPIIAFGPNSACPHWKTSKTQLENNSVILIDIGVELDGYQSDMTRMVFFKEVHPLLIKAAEYVEEAYNRASLAAIPGVLPHSLDDLVRNYFASLGLKESFLHGLGHGVGLQIHESPRMNQNYLYEKPLDLGDIITIEPGLYFEGIGGIRLENTCVITERGARSLMTLPIAPILLTT